MDIKFDGSGLIPAVAQDYISGRVLMVAYMNGEALKKTLELKKAVFYSRSRQKLWIKGETSGNYLELVDIFIDCDRDAVLLLVKPMGPACHTGETSCFYRGIEGDSVADRKYNPYFSMLSDLYKTIEHRRENPKEGSYTNYLFDKGIDKILKKVGEETAEVIIGAKNSGKDEIRYEIADLMYHLSVLMAQKDLTWDEVFRELKERHKPD